MSSTKVDFPLPETPVTQRKHPRGKEALTFLRLFSLAPRIVSQPSCSGGLLLPWSFERGATRCFGTAIRARPERYSAVIERFALRISPSLPCATLSPARGPAPGPGAT